MKNNMKINFCLFFVTMLLTTVLSTQIIVAENLYGTLSDGRSIKLDTNSMKWEFYTGIPKGKISVKFIELKESRGRNCNVVFEVTNATDLHFERIQNTFIIYNKFGESKEGYATIGSNSSPDGIAPNQTIVVEYEHRIKCSKLVKDKIEMKALSCEQETMKSRDASKFCRDNIIFPSKVQKRLF